MADYRQFCANPACGYNGFNGHSPGCPVPAEQDAYRKELQRRRDEEDAAWRNFFDGMSEESLFQYAADAQKGMEDARKYELRWNRVREYMQRKYKLSRYLKSRRK